MTFKERAAAIEADLDLWQTAQRAALKAEKPDIATARKCADAIHKLTNAIVKLKRDECEAVLERLEAAEKRREEEAKAEADLDAFQDEMRHASQVH